MSDKGMSRSLFKYRSHVAELEGHRPDLTELELLQVLLDGRCRHAFADPGAYVALQEAVADIGDLELTRELAAVEAQDGEYVRVREFTEFARKRLQELKEMATK